MPVPAGTRHGATCYRLARRVTANETLAEVALGQVSWLLLLRHAAQCCRCRDALAESQEVAAALAETGPAAEPSQPLATF